MRGLLALILATGCYTDPAGNTCPSSFGTGDGYCPSDTDSGGSSSPKYHSYSQGQARAFADHIRFVMAGSEPSEPTMLETMTVRLGEPATDLIPVTHAGEPLQATRPRLSVIAETMYLTWSAAGADHGALLLTDGALDIGVSVSFPSGVETVSRLGSRHFVRHATEDGVVTATMIDIDGNVQGTLEVARGVYNEVRATTDDSDMLYALAYYTEGNEELRIVRVSAAGSVLDPDGLVIARKTMTPTVTKSFIGAAIAATATGEVLVIYGLQDRNFHREIHAVHVTGTTLTDLVMSELSAVPELVANGNHIIALTEHEVADGPSYYEARPLDVHGTILSAPVFAGTLGWQSHTIPLGDGFGLINEAGDVSITPIGLDGAAGPETIVASRYELDTGCNAGGSSSLVLVLAVAAFAARQRKQRYRKP